MGLKDSRYKSPVTASKKTNKDASWAIYSFIALLRLVLSIHSPPTSLMKRFVEFRYLNIFFIFQMAMANKIICTDQSGMAIRCPLTGLNRLIFSKNRQRWRFNVAFCAAESRIRQRINHPARRYAGFDGVPVITPQFRRLGTAANQSGEHRHDPAHVAFEQKLAPGVLGLGDFEQAQAAAGFEYAVKFAERSGQVADMA